VIRKRRPGKSSSGFPIQHEYLLYTHWRNTKDRWYARVGYLTSENRTAEPDDPLSALLPIRDWYRSAAETYGLLGNAGFAPMSVRDWRSRGHDVVLVDFGQDLEPAGIAIDSESECSLKC
jgi:hypothetical protein